MYWTLKSIPELAHLPKTEAQRVWRRHCWKVFFSRRVLRAFLIAPIFFTLPWLVGTLFPDMPLPAYLSGAVICLVLGFASVLYWPQLLDAQKSKENLHNKQVNGTVMDAIPLALATLSTAAANNSIFDPLCIIFGPPNWHHSPVIPVFICRVPPYCTQEYHMLHISPAQQRHNAMGWRLARNRRMPRQFELRNRHPVNFVRTIRKT